ncbi:BNS1 protein [Cordyceps javanica]|uniref:BNS1 protein n=1 Tax=Cordyceps javanica TaxID=43265 RepID=A0A545UNP6_9HYPO|nr:BNS1 protein [Cordyceps javanica]
MSSHVLGEKDVNAAMEQSQQTSSNTQQSKDVKSMDYHRQVFQSKMAQEPYVSRTAKAAASASASASCSRLPPTTIVIDAATASPRPPFRPAAVLAARNTTSSSDASSCSFLSSCPSPVPSLISQHSSSSSSSTSSSPTPSITVLHRCPTNKILAVASTKQYVSPSDNIMSPCSAKINEEEEDRDCLEKSSEFINSTNRRLLHRAKPKSLFAQASAKKLSGENLFGSKSIPKA